ncbi:stage IV sporulation protein A [Anaerostipes sp.]|uniref:stage IV sporulation protein A n=1 Tax=Anaerostipes sp. TaxID=1872530 RepID=UPI0025BB6A65|nr:stage IV sporulation protein A [Anaerostipes sp.]MBS7008373.1 stage IV sporulation protein A [Anaerostipes sp.]
MDYFNVYKDIMARTDGEIYIGVVGPVRTGKSTFIKRFMNLMVLPNMENENERNRANDELPQSSSGKTIMTTEPKFVPNEAVEINVDDGISMKVRLIDCVGYMVNGAVGHIEGEEERLVKTPWFDYEIPFTKAASIGTKKVITEHSTIGIVVTTDGSFGDIEAANYQEPEEETIKQLKALHKPFVVLLNTSRPYSEDTVKLAREKEEKYGAKVLPMNCEQLKKDDIYFILKSVLMEFPISSIGFFVPKWVEVLPKDHKIKQEIMDTARRMLMEKDTMKDIYEEEDYENQYIKQWKLDSVAMDTGVIRIAVDMDDSYYYEFLSDTIGLPIKNEYEFISIMQDLARQKKEYEEVADALNAVKQRGYGVVTPTKGDIVLEEPKIVKHGNKYGVKIKASAPSIHMIRANISTEIAPIVGEEYQAKDLMEYFDKGKSDSQESIWDINIFGKTLEQLVGEGMQSKAQKMTEESQQKLQDTMEKIVNESNGGLVCIII